MGRSAGAIVGHKSKEKIPEFILKAALREDDWCWLPTSNSTYGKWFDGSRTPDGNLWSIVATKFQEDQFIDQLAGSLNDSTLGQVMIRFHIPINEGDTPDKRLLAFALAKQFHAIAEGDGNANDIAKDFYKPDTFITTFPKYAERALDKFSKIKMPFSPVLSIWASISFTALLHSKISESIQRKRSLWLTAGWVNLCCCNVSL